MRKPQNILPLHERCCVMVSGEGAWGAFHQHQCRKKGIIERDGKLYCKIHDPVYINEKRDKSWNEYLRKSEIRTKHFERNQILNELFDGIETDTIKNKFAQYQKAIKQV